MAKQKPLPIIDAPACLIYQHLRGPRTQNGNNTHIFHIYSCPLRSTDPFPEYLGWIEDGGRGTHFMKGRVTVTFETITVSGTRSYKQGQQFHNKPL